MPSEPAILEYALIVTTASSCNRPSSELRVKYSINGDIHSASIPMTVADFAKMVEDHVFRTGGRHNSVVEILKGSGKSGNVEMTRKI